MMRTLETMLKMSHAVMMTGRKISRVSCPAMLSGISEIDCKWGIYQNSLFYKVYSHLKPEYWEHHLWKVAEQILDALDLPEEHIDLEPHLDLDRDRGLWLHPEAGLVLTGVWPHPILELAQVAGVRLVKMRPRHEGGGLHLALSHVL